MYKLQQQQNDKYSWVVAKSDPILRWIYSKTIMEMELFMFGLSWKDD